MKLFKSIFVLFLTGVLLFTAQSSANAWKFDKSLQEGEYLIDHANAAMIVNDVDPNVLFNLMTDHTKDKLFYFGVGEAVLISGDGGKGSVWTEESFVGLTTIHVLKKDAPMEYVITGDSPFFRYIATYKFTPGPDNTVKYWSYNTIVTSIPGLTAEFFKLYLDAGDQNILNYLGKTGVIVEDVPPLSDDVHQSFLATDWDVTF